MKKRHQSVIPMKKKNWFLIIFILAAILLIVTVIWIYAKRIEKIESKMKMPTVSKLKIK